MNNVPVALSNVGKTFNEVSVVDNLSLVIESGEIFGLLGPNGVEKSTTIPLLITLTQPHQGKIEVAGYDVTCHPNLVKRNIGIVLKQISVDGDLLCLGKSGIPRQNASYFSFRKTTTN